MNNNNNSWFYNGVLFEPELIDPEVTYGFVYMIEQHVTHKKYIGKKFFFSSKILPVTKTRKRRKRIKVESDWRDYHGSSKELLEDIEKHGKESVTRTILHLCQTKAECAYKELKEQIDREVLLKPDIYYNGFLGGKIHRNHLKHLII